MENEQKNLPIGIFDSGVGGLTVYRALHDFLPREHFVYLGDTARVPYGTKSLTTVERYAVENASFLHRCGIKMLIVACNTASALALPKIREHIGVETVGVIGAGARAAVRETTRRFENGLNKRSQPCIGVIATEATIASGAYVEAIARVAPETEVLQKACPLFVPLAEEGWANSDEARSIARSYLNELIEAEIDALVLGCTHYPILRETIRQTVGESVALIDSGEATALEIAEILKNKDLERSSNAPISRSRRLCDDLDHFFVTDAAERFARVAERFLGSQPSRLEAVEIWGNDELRTK